MLYLLIILITIAVFLISLSLPPILFGFFYRQSILQEAVNRFAFGSALLTFSTILFVCFFVLPK